MKKIVLFLILSGLISGIFAQEIKDFELRYSEKRYEFKFSLPTDNWNSNYDLYIFAKEKGTQSFFKANTIMGEFRNLPTAWGKLTVFWDPFFDSRKATDYDFKLYAVPLKFVKDDYYYMGVNQVGVLKVSSKLKNAYYELASKRLQDGDILALPSGNYEIQVYQESRLISKNLLNIPPFGILDADLTPLYGSLKLSSAISGTLYAIDNANYSPQSEYQLTQGSYTVYAKAMQANPAYPALTSQINIEIRHNQTSQYFFEFPYGTLDLNSDLENTSYSVQGRSYPQIKGMMLKPGFVEVQAVNKENPSSSLQSEALRLEIRKGMNTTHKFNFLPKWGTLIIQTSKKLNSVTINNITQSPKTEYGLPEGVYQLTIALSGGKKVESGPLEIKAKESTVFDLDKAAAKIGVVDGLYLSIFERADLHYFSAINKDSKTPDSFALSLTGLNAGFTKSKNGFFLKYYLGAGNNLYAIYNPDEKVVSYAADLVSLGIKAGIAPFAGKIKLFGDVNGYYLGASPILTDKSLEGTKYRFITKFTDSGKKKSSSSYAYSLGFNIAANLEIRPWENTSIYAFTAMKVDDLDSGAWYVDQEVKNWEKDPDAPKPNKATNEYLPKHNFPLDGTLMDLGLGIKLRF